MTSKRLGIVGYSTRALAQAAVDLGFQVHAIDAFCDQDLLDCAECELALDWPRDIALCAARVRCDGWLLAGGMEHHGRRLSQLAEQAPLLGPSRQQIQRLRSLRYWRRLADRVPGLELPTSSGNQNALCNSRQLFKPSRSSGGVYVTDAEPLSDPASRPRGYWQQFIPGRGLGVTAVFNPHEVSLCGATEALTAVDWPGPKPYIYRGSLGPIQLTPSQQQTVLEIAFRIREDLGLVGTLQADFIEDEHGRLWLLEINPRWTAGMEVLHLCSQQIPASPLAAHLRAFGVDVQIRTPPLQQEATLPMAPRWLAKAVIYASHEGSLSRSQREWLQELRHWRDVGTPLRSIVEVRPNTRQVPLPRSKPSEQPEQLINPLRRFAWSICDVPALGGDEALPLRTGEPLLTMRVAAAGEDGPWWQIRQELLHALHAAYAAVAEQLFNSNPAHIS